MTHWRETDKIWLKVGGKWKIGDVVHVDNWPVLAKTGPAVLLIHIGGGRMVERTTDDQIQREEP